VLPTPLAGPRANGGGWRVGTSGVSGVVAQDPDGRAFLASEENGNLRLTPLRV